MAEQDPPQIASFVRFLEDVGYQVVEDVYDADHFGNRVIRVVGQTLDARIVRDRSDWFVELRRHDTEGWHGVAAWIAQLGQDPADPTGLLSTSDEFGAVKARLPEFERLAQRPGLSERLTAFEHEQTKAHIDRFRRRTRSD